MVGRTVSFKDDRVIWYILAVSYFQFLSERRYLGFQTKENGECTKLLLGTAVQHILALLKTFIIQVHK